MNLKQMFKQPIDKNDLMPVVRQGIFMTFVGGLMIGSLHLLVSSMFGLSLIWMMFFIFAIVLAKRIISSFLNYHILYAVIGVLTILVTYYMFSLVYFFGYFLLIDALQTAPISYLLNPLVHFEFLNPFSPSFFGIENILDVIFFVIVNVYVFRLIK